MTMPAMAPGLRLLPEFDVVGVDDPSEIGGVVDRGDRDEVTKAFPVMLVEDVKRKSAGPVYDKPVPL